MKYQTIRNEAYDFLNQSYASSCPNLHKYPATMIPQIGIKLFKDFNINTGNLLDPYCGSGSSFISGLEHGIQEMYGFDINPLAILISKVKFTKVNQKSIYIEKKILKDNILNAIENDENSFNTTKCKITNINFWFSKEVIKKILILKYFINQISNENIKNIFLIPFSETVRECSYTRNNEFKLYKMKHEDILIFNPEVIETYFHKLHNTIEKYVSIYLPKLTDKVKIEIKYSNFKTKKDAFTTVLTSPPYGDSKTTVAYGQFSTLSNEWMDINYARKVDSMLMGGKKSKNIYVDGIISAYISEIYKLSPSRALEISSFYNDLEISINQVAHSVQKKGKIFYIVGNRTVKGVQLPTDQFIAEKFEKNQFKHIITFQRILGNKSMPSKNSPSNKKGELSATMLYEYIVVCEKE